MITCVIKIMEVSGRGVMVDMNPDQSKATPREIEIAGVIDHVMGPVFDWITSATGRGEMIESKDAESVRAIIEERMKAFFET